MKKPTAVKVAVTLLKKVTAVVLFCTGIVLLSCAAPKISLPYTLSGNYINANLSTRPLILGLPDTQKIVITNPKDVENDYGGLNATPQSRIEKFYLPIFVESFRSYMSGDTLIVADGYRSEFSLRDFDKKTTVLKTGRDSSSLQFVIPTKPSLQKAGLDSAVVVLIDRLTFKRNKLYIEYYWDSKTKQPANLEVEADVVIWDYKNDAPVFYGMVSNKIDFQIAMSRKHWEESARTLAKKIILYAKCL